MHSTADVTRLRTDWSGAGRWLSDCFEWEKEEVRSLAVRLEGVGWDAMMRCAGLGWCQAQLNDSKATRGYGMEGRGGEYVGGKVERR
jgi:hypothetical protein